MTDRKTLVLWGWGPVNRALAARVLDNGPHALVGVYSFCAEDEGLDVGACLGRAATGLCVATAEEAMWAQHADCVILEPPAALSVEQVRAITLRLLRRGWNVISTDAAAEVAGEGQIPAAHAVGGTDSPIAGSAAVMPGFTGLLEACEAGKCSFHATGLFPHWMAERLALTLGKALQTVEQVRVVQSVDCAALPADSRRVAGMPGVGVSGLVVDDLRPFGRSMQAAMQQVALQLFGDAGEALPLDGAIRTECEIETVKASGKQAVNGITVKKGGIVAIKAIHRAWRGEHLFLVCETHWYLGKENASYGDDIPYGHFNTPYSFTVQVVGEPSRLDAQLEFEPCVPGVNPLVHVTVQGILAAIEPVCAAEPGIVLQDASPRYQQDDRLPSSSNVTHPGARYASSAKRRQEPYRIVIWGPGEIGGAATRAALQRKNLQIVGAKVFSPHKHGKDLGELVGMGPIGVKATRSTAEIKALRPDCVIMAPQPRAIVEGLDNDVLELLEAGINVITSAAYHNVTMPNWLGASQTPMQLLREVAQTTGMARTRAEEIAFGLNARVMRAAGDGLLAQWLTPAINKVLTPVVNKAMPFRATPERLLQACRTGGASLHGTGVHPTFMAERVGMQLASMLESVEHMRFVEAADFSYMPDGMWGGLSSLGFGKPVEALDAQYLIARAGDFYYGDVIGNAAHLLYGVPSAQVRVERSFRALPAERDFRVGSTRIRKGCAAALHMVHKGFIGQHHFFTNEECWYLGPDREYRGDDLPFGHFATPISYTVDITGQPSRLRMQLSMDGTGAAAEIFTQADNSTADLRCALGKKMRDSGITNPITNATAMALLDAVGPVCEMAPGVVIDDIRPGFRCYHERPHA